MGTDLVGITDVARQVGIAAGTLRTWERRYGVVVPRRDAKGRRLYDAGQIALLRRIVESLRMGRRVARAHEEAVAALLTRSTTIYVRPGRDPARDVRQAVDTLLGDSADPETAFRIRLLAVELARLLGHAGRGPEPTRIELGLLPGEAQVGVERPGARLSIEALRGEPELGQSWAVVEALTDGWSIGRSGEATAVRARLELRRPEPSRPDAQ